MALRRPGFRGKPKAALDPVRAADFGAAHAAAEGLLARRDLPSQELLQKLCNQGYDRVVAEEAVAELSARGAVDDARFAANFVAYHAGRGQGPLRIRQELKARVPDDQIEQALEAYPDWPALVRRVRSGKFGAAVPADWQSKARQARFLQYRGFSADHIRLALGSDFDESELPGPAD
jgi:regulatory protein